MYLCNNLVKRLLNADPVLEYCWYFYTHFCSKVMTAYRTVFSYLFYAVNAYLVFEHNNFHYHGDAIDAL